MASNLTQFIAPAIQALGGLSQVGQGASLSVLGGDMAAASFRQAGVASLAAANYNNTISRLNFNRQMDVLSRDIRSFVSQQTVSKATTGFESSSRSFLDVTNDTFNIFERGIIQARNSQKQAEAATLFEGQAAQVEFENRARSAQYAGQVAAYNSQASAVSSIGSMFTKAFSSFSF